MSLEKVATVGAFVKYVIAPGVIRPALIVDTDTFTWWDLHVFVKGKIDIAYLTETERPSWPNGTNEITHCGIWRSHVLYDVQKGVGTFHLLTD